MIPEISELVRELRGCTDDAVGILTRGLRNRAADALEHLSERAAQGWQPIETAPKDGKRVLLYENFAVRTVMGARWVGSPHDVWIADNGSYLRRASLWMPLPASPVVVSSPVTHASDCAVHNGPALPAGPCDCGAVSGSTEGGK